MKQKYPEQYTEMKKICGFPDTFIVPEHVNYGDLFGNMATPPVLEAILCPNGKFFGVYLVKSS